MTRSTRACELCPITGPRLSSRIASVGLERVTVFGDVVVDRLYATEALIQGTVRVTDALTLQTEIAEEIVKGVTETLARGGKPAALHL